MRIPVMHHIVTDADGWDCYTVVGEIGRSDTYRIIERAEKVWTIQYWNGHNWSEVVALSEAPRKRMSRPRYYSPEEAITIAHTLVTGRTSDG